MFPRYLYNCTYSPADGRCQCLGLMLRVVTLSLTSKTKMTLRQTSPGEGSIDTASMMASTVQLGGRQVNCWTRDYSLQTA